MEKIFKKKYLKAIFSSHLSLDNDQHFLQKSFEKANINITTCGFCFIYTQAISQAFLKTKT